MRNLLVAAALLLAGCSSQELGPEWLPLETLQESQSMTVGLSSGGARTVGTVVYVKDLDEWLARHPEPLFSAVLRHEQVHAIRQLDEGVSAWVSRYLTDTDFMWGEEQLGWHQQLIHLQQSGYGVIPEGVALILHDYKSLSGTMVTYQEALEWVRQVLAGQWSPSNP